MWPALFRPVSGLGYFSTELVNAAELWNIAVGVAKHKRQTKRQRDIESEPRSEASAENAGLTFNPFAGLAQLAASLPSGSASPSDADQAPGASAMAPAERN